MTDKYSKITKKYFKKYGNDFLEQLENDTYKTITDNKFTVKQLEKLITEASDLYYNTDKTLVSDNCFDRLRDVLREMSPNSSVLDEIGAPVEKTTVNKEKLPYHLGSMDKIKPGTSKLTNWYKKYKGPYVISDKLDGLSGLLTITLIKPENFNENKNNYELEYKMLTRGGKDNIGRNITHLVKYCNVNRKMFSNGENNGDKYNKYSNKIIKYILANKEKLFSKYEKTGELKLVLALRGEIIMRDEIFESKYKDDYPKGRSLIAGLTAKKPSSFMSTEKYKNISKDVDFVCYQIIEPEDMLFSEQFETIKKLGFNCVNYEQITSREIGDETGFQEILLEHKKVSPYEIDGIIVGDNSKSYPNPESGNPKHAVAFKMDLAEQSQETTVEEIEYNISKNGILKPRIKFKEIKIGGDSIRYATAFNAKFIKDNCLGIGSKIRIVRSGDVIPYIAEVLTKTPDGKWFQPNVEWKWNETKTDAIATNLDEVPEILGKQLLHFFTTLKVDGMKIGTINRLINAGFTTINQILSIKHENLIDVEGFKTKSIDNLLKSFKEQVLDKDHELVVLMTASNIFQNFGVRKLRMLFKSDKINNKRLLDVNYLDGKNYEQLYNDILEVDGFSDKTAKLFCENINKFQVWLKEHLRLKVKSDELINLEVISNDEKDKFIKDTTVVFTGVRNKDLEAYIEKNGGKVASGISKNTTYLIVKDKTQTSSKTEKAKKLEITIYEINEYINKTNFS